MYPYYGDRDGIGLEVYVDVWGLVGGRVLWGWVMVEGYMVSLLVSLGSVRGIGVGWD